jgi:predicted transposase YbfD/YdcC
VGRARILPERRGWLRCPPARTKDCPVSAHPHPASRIADAFADLSDPRIDRTKRHHLLDMLTITLCGVRCGAETWVEIADWADAKRVWLTAWLGLQHGSPSHATLGRVFDRLDPVQFEAGVAHWVRGLASSTAGDIAALDGTTVRRSGDTATGRAPLHLVSAWAHDQRLVLGQEAVAETSNEITAIPLLLERLVLTDQIVTIDAMGCQRAIAAQSIDQGGAYVLALKENQADLLEDVAHSFAVATTMASAHRTVGNDHGRRETRICETIADPTVLAWLDPAQAWPGLQSVARVTATRRVGEQDPTTTTRYSLSSLPGNARTLAHAVRRHWGIENQLHWVVDVAFREDDNRTRRGHRSENLALIRKLALNLLRREPTRKHGIKASRLRAGWDTDYLLHVLDVNEMQSPCLLHDTTSLRGEL